MNNSLVPADGASLGLTASGAPTGVTIAPDRGWDLEPREESSDPAARFRRYWAAIKRYWWLVVLLTAIGTAGGVIGTQFVDPVYVAQGSVLIADLSTRGGDGGSQFKNPSLLPNGAWIEFFKTYTVVEEVVARQKLWYHPRSWQDSVALDGIRPTERVVAGNYIYQLDSLDHYTLKEAKAGLIEQGVFGDTVGRKVGFTWLPTKTGLMGRHWVGFHTLEIRPLAETLRNDLDIKVQENSNIVRPTFSWPRQRDAADILNTWMQAFVDKAQELRVQSLSANADRLSEQRNNALDKVHAAQTALQNFRTNTITKPSEGAGPSAAASGMGTGDILASEYVKQQREYEALKNDREALETLASSSASSASISSLDIINAIPSAQQFPRLMLAVNDLVKQEADIRAMHDKGMLDSLRSVRDANAAIQALRTQTIPSLASDAARVLKTREQRMLTSMQSDSAKLSSIPAQSIEESTLRRDLSVAENLYLRLDNEYETRRLAALSSTQDVSIIDHALPTERPLRNIVIALIGGGVVGSLVLGIILALLLDFADHRFRYPEQITHDLKLDVLGAIPSVPAPGDAAKDPEAMVHSVEAFRGLRMNVHHAFLAPPIMLTISSPGAGDGKSMVASNLALSLAEAGYRTLLIDGDIRRGKLHSVFGIDRRPGLLDFLAGDTELDAVIRTAPVHKNLSLISSGTRRYRGPELLTSARFLSMMNTLRPQYDAILVDSAPLAAGIDAYALGAATGNMIVVMRTGLTDRRVAKAKLKVAERLPIRILGAVVNSVPAAGMYSEYSYLYGYDMESDIESLPAGEEMTVLQTSGPAR